MAKPFSDIFQSFSSVMELFRDPKFQDLLVNFERAKRVFLIGYDVRDQVTSELLFAREDSVLKPVDYLIAFSQFIKQNQTAIEAISVLLNKPKQWNTSVLNDLKKTLKLNTFFEDDLLKAHQYVYHKEMIDIISMIKHAAKETEPLLSPDERVTLAIAKVTAGLTLTTPQQKWMGYISEHLKLNMTLDETDLKEAPNIC